MNRWLLPLLPWIPVPYRLLRRFLLEDNKAQNETDGWARLRDPNELPRYRVISDYLRAFADGGAVLDVGCADGILQERIAYGSYLGIDMFGASIARAQPKADARTRFLCADAATFVPEERFDAIVWNECLYYLAEPIDVITRYRQYLRPNGVMIVSMFDQTFATRRLFRQLNVLGEVRADTRLVARNGLAWVLRVYDASLDRSAR
jgi:2-polyprenyl-3-methyl-5-hydroxy-6-metoxy-1,4-benzoquinol methylase